MLQKSDRNDSKINFALYHIILFSSYYPTSACHILPLGINTNTISCNEGSTRTYGDEASHNMKGRPSTSLKSTPFLFVIPHGRTILS